MINDGSLGVVTRQEPEAILGTKSATGHEWMVTQLPGLGIPVSAYYYESVGDYSAMAGAGSAHADRAMKRHYAFSVDVGIVPAFINDLTTIASPIMKLDIAST